MAVVCFCCELHIAIASTRLRCVNYMSYGCCLFLLRFTQRNYETDVAMCKFHGYISSAAVNARITVQVNYSTWQAKVYSSGRVTGNRADDICLCTTRIRYQFQQADDFEPTMRAGVRCASLFQACSVKGASRG